MTYGLTNVSGTAGPVASVLNDAILPRRKFLLLAHRENRRGIRNGRLRTHEQRDYTVISLSELTKHPVNVPADAVFGDKVKGQGKWLIHN